MAKLISDRCRDGECENCDWPRCACGCHDADDPDRYHNEEYDR